MSLMMPLLLMGFCFLLGSIPSAYLAGKLKGIDIREHGSGNVGATNAYRVLGAQLGLIVLLADAAKGALATYLGTLVGGDVMGIAAGVIAMLGHSYSPFVSFKGGKGVATGAGMVVALFPLVALACIVIFIAVVGISRYVSLGSILVACLLPLLLWLAGESLPMQGFGLVIAVFVTWRHRANISRLIAGTENKILFGGKKTE